MKIKRTKFGLFSFGRGCIRVDRIKTNNQERIIYSPSQSSNVRSKTRYKHSSVTPSAAPQLVSRLCPHMGV